MLKNNQISIGWLALGMTVVAVIVLIAGRIVSESAKSKRTNREVALACTTDMATQFHIHPYLSIFVNGKAQEIPTNIGIVNGCMNAIHTHDASGKLHVESPEKRDFALSDFFAVWQKPFTKDRILDYQADVDHAITVTVNGAEVTTYENTVLYDGDKIIIKYEPIK